MLPCSPSGPALALLASALVSSATAQLTTKCNPLEKACPPDPALGTSHTFYFNSTPPDDTFTSEANAIEYDEKKGAIFTISDQGHSATLASDFYFFFGRTEVLMKAAKGQGIISSIVWGSDTLDEVDWEFKGGNETWVFSNYFGKGNTNVTGTGGDHPVTGSIYDLHNYTSVWTKEKLEWHLDGQLIRTLHAKDANGGNDFPQTPMTLRLGSWVGGDTETQAPGTVEWAGGPTDYSQGPFRMYVESARVEDFSSGKEYTYTDKSGSWQSIKATVGNSTAAESINKPPEKSLSEKWAELPESTKIGIYAAAGAVGGILFIALAVYYIKQRRQGQREAALAAKMHEEERVELERFRKEGRNPDDLQFSGTEYVGAAGKGGMSGSYSAIADSPPGSSAGPPEKTWDPMGSDGMTSGMPLLHNEGAAPLRNGLTSPVHSQSPGLPPAYPLPSSPVNRGHSASPYAPTRMGSTGPGSPQARSPGSPAPHDMYGMARVNSPGPMQLNHGPGSPGPQGDYWNGGGGGGGHR
ncbi:putative glycosyl hydrolase family 16 [Rosellinia necatrix]|uniref:chitinase n=1 Tax=Rosellinia necatrix TaxID=77044 RepID=A0A1W2TPA4_ROSNE|nr:putative glycosyl hydrolase family 16 [Rosellinia necatrix]